MGKAIEITQECLDAFAPLSDNAQVNPTAPKFIIFQMTDDFLSASIAHISSNTSTYNDMISHLPQDHCRWIVYSMQPSDHHLLSENNVPQSLCFIAWSPESSPIKQKMIYSANKGFFLRGLPGGTDMTLFQATSLEEVQFPVIVDRMIEKKIAQ